MIEVGKRDVGRELHAMGKMFKKKAGGGNRGGGVRNPLVTKEGQFSGEKKSRLVAWRIGPHKRKGRKTMRDLSTKEEPAGWR